MTERQTGSGPEIASTCRKKVGRRYFRASKATGIGNIHHPRTGLITHILTVRGSCFTADAFEKACQHQDVDWRRTRAYSSQTNGMVERFNGRVATEVLPINVAHHVNLEALLRGFNRAYNQRRQRVLGGLSPTEKVAERLRRQPSLHNRSYKPTPEASIMNEVDRIMLYANDVSQPDTA